MVDEVVQDTFLAVWRKPESYRGKGEVAAWIWGIGIRRLIDALPRFDGRPSVGSSPCAMAVIAVLATFLFVYFSRDPAARRSGRLGVHA